MIVDIVELLDQKDSNFSTLFGEATKASKIDLVDKMAEIEKNKSRKVKNSNCTMKYNKEIQGIEIKVGGFNICICSVDDFDIREVSRNEEEVKFAFIKTHEEAGIVEYDYSLIYDAGEFKLMPTVIRQGQTRPRFSEMHDLTESEIQVLKGEAVLHA